VPDSSSIFTIQLGQRTFEIENAPKRVVRWAIGSRSGLRSSPWRLWGSKRGDVYVSVRTLGGIFKATFHRDQNCFVGFTSQYERTARRRFPSLRSRILEKWTLPEQQLTRVIQIVVPHAELRSFQSKHDTEVTWLPGPPEGFMGVVSVFFFKPGTPFNIPTAGQSVRPVGLVATDLRIALAVYAHAPIDEASAHYLNTERTRLAQAASEAQVPKQDGVRFAAFASGAQHNRAFFEIAWS
jgi:hypothetical protein